MISPIKARLVGLFFFVALAIVVGSLFFDGKPLEPIPPVPGLPLSLKEELAPVADPINRRDPAWGYRSEIKELKKETEAMQTVPDYLAEPTDQKEAANKTEMDRWSNTTFNEDHLPEAWGLQLGSFTAHENAISLKQRVDERFVEQGHRAYLALIETDGHRLYRVAVGPFLSRAEAIRIQSFLQQEEIVKAPILKLFSLLKPTKDKP